MLRRTALIGFVFLSLAAVAQQAKDHKVVHHPWDDVKLSSDARAAMVLAQMTMDEKLAMIHGMKESDVPGIKFDPIGTVQGMGYLPGIPRLGIPSIEMADSAVGIRQPENGSRYITLLPSTIGLASSWDQDAAMRYGQLIGHEMRQLGLDMSIGGGVDIMREPRNGRNFEYAGEDPILAGTMVGTLEAGVLSQHAMSDIKHYAFNDQETGRRQVNVAIGEKAMRESDLLAFEIALEIAKPSAVMCSYNLVNTEYACENDYLLKTVLRNEFHFQGFVVSDWSAAGSTERAALAGLDVEMEYGKYFGKPFADAMKSGQISEAQLNVMVSRVLRSLFASGVVDDPPVREIVDPFNGRDVAQKIAEESIVLLQNGNAVLPLSLGVRHIALIGAHADVGVISGGGSAQVPSPEGNAAQKDGKPAPGPTYFPSSPLREIQSHAIGANVTFDEGTNLKSAASTAKNADVAIVFVTQPMREAHDAKSLALPDMQDDLIEAVAAANPHTIVVIESGGPVTMPWKNKVAGIIEAWYPGIGGAQALANLLFGTVNFSAKLPATFPASEAQLPHPVIPGLENGPLPKNPPIFNANYNIEGARVGYKWFQSEKREPLFPFGFGLSYTTYSYSGLSVDTSKLTVSFSVKNTGKREGTDIAELYISLPQSVGEAFRRLAGWQRVDLQPGESKTVTIAVDKRALSIFDVATHSWQIPKGEFQWLAGGSSDDLPLHAVTTR
jgi:beta-glucosidase